MTNPIDDQATAVSRLLVDLDDAITALKSAAAGAVQKAKDDLNEVRGQHAAAVAAHAKRLADLTAQQVADHAKRLQELERGRSAIIVAQRDLEEGRKHVQAREQAIELRSADLGQRYRQGVV